MTLNQGPKDLRQAAAEFRRRYYGPSNSPGQPPAMSELAPEVMNLVDSVIYGEIYNRPAVNLQTRSLCTIAALVVIGHSPQLIKRHIQGALHVGVTKEQISEIIAQMIFYGGMPAAVRAFQVAKETFDEYDDRFRGSGGRWEPGQGSTSPAESGQATGTSPSGFPSAARETSTTGRSGSDEDRVHRHGQYGQSHGGQSGQSRAPANRPRSPARGGNQSSGDGRGVGRQSKGGGAGKRSGVHFTTRPPGRGGGGPGRRRNTGGRR
ncbi:MAG: hypothetical protein BZY75_04980 [SAR202 cluster bacterium Io17-Chloro-G7]|nr:MAG: hypothetical protein BZY75_04980 [SAR202 cluster bacterium Io17-Chloro-G7]